MEVTTEDEARLYVHERPGDGHVIVLLHGYSLDHTIWGPVADALEATGARVVVPDIRGHGRSTLGAAHPDLQRLVDDVEEVIGSLGLDHVHVIGHSLGAFIALGARTDPSLQCRLSSVVAISGMARSISNPLQRVGARIFSSSYGPKLLRHRWIGRALMKPWFGPNPHDAELDRMRLLSARCGAPARPAIATATSNIDLRPSFKRPGAPTLIVCGELDKATPPRHSHSIANEIPASEITVVPQAGHMVITEEAGVVATTIMDWIDKRSR